MPANPEHQRILARADGLAKIAEAYVAQDKALRGHPK